MEIFYFTTYSAGSKYNHDSKVVLINMKDEIAGAAIKKIIVKA